MQVVTAYLVPHTTALPIQLSVVPSFWINVLYLFQWDSSFPSFPTVEKMEECVH